MNDMSMTEGSDTSLPLADTTPPPQGSFISTKQLIDYVKKVLNCFDDESSTEQLHRRLSDSSDLLHRFIGDPQTKSIFVQKISISPEDDGSGSGGISLPPSSTTATDYLVSAEVNFTSIHSTGLLFTKRGSTLEAEKSIPSQLRTVVLNEGSPYETLHSYIASAVSPYFKSFLHSTEVHPNDAQATDNKLGPSIEKKLTELELGLLHLQQNIDIPEISLVIHPTVAQVISSCAKEGKKPRIEDFGDSVDDSSFLNALQQGVNRWIKEIQKVTKLERDPTSGTTLQEINFWLNLERSLMKLQEKRESLEIELTLDILRHGKRFHATVSFDTDTGLKGALATVTDYNQLMKDFPINDLLSAGDLDKIRYSLQGIFIHMKKIRNTKYPIQRLLRLIEAISKDLQVQLLKVLANRRLMVLPFGDFEQIMAACFDIFNTWDEEYERLQVQFRDVMKKKRGDEMKLIWRISPTHKKLAGRIEQIRKFRFQHEQLRAVIERVLRSGDYQQHHQQPPVAFANDSYVTTPNEEIRSAYALVEHVDILDVSKDGTEIWEDILKAYNEKINSVEAKITGELREQLATAKSANEMFRIFARFNALFVRPQIRGAIREYQTQLIYRVKDDIEKLHEKFKVQYALSKAFRMSELRDIPPVAGSIIWAKQIDRQLNTYLKRVESILGVGWENHVDGQRLKADGDSFRQKLNTQWIFEEWLTRVQQRDTTVTGRIFDIETTRMKNPNTGKHILRLKVNFLPEVITLSKEVRHLKNLGFRVPLAIMNKAHQANQMYPFAISLMESIRTYERALEKIDDNFNVNLLIAGIRQEIHTLLAEGMGLVWESYKLDSYVKKLSENIFQFAEKVDEVLCILEEIYLEIKSLETCLYSNKTISEILNKIQKAVDNLSLKNYTNLQKWILWIDSEVESRLSTRLQLGIVAWTKKLDGIKTEEEEEEGVNKKNLGGEPELGELKMELRMTQQTLWAFPPVEDIRQQLLTKLFAWEAIITLQPRIQSSRYQVTLDKSSQSLYKDVLSKLPGGKGTLEAAYSAIERKYSLVNNYVNEWLCYQSLWDLQPEALYDKLANDLNLWINCLNDIKQTRSTFDTTEVRKPFGPIIVEYGKVQSKVSLKYDAWHKDVLTKFSHLLSTQMNVFYGEIGRARHDLEQQSIETSSTSEAVNLITYVQNLKKKILAWEDEVVIYRDGQRLLERQRFQLPFNWLHIDTIDGEWSSFMEILKRKDTSIQTQVATLRTKILNEDKLVDGRIETFLDDWEKDKPIKYDTKPIDALNQLTHFEARHSKLNDERVNILKAKEALEIQTSNQLNSPFGIAFEELLDLRQVWAELSKITEQLDVLREKLWLSVVPRKIRGELDNLLNQLKSLPGKLKQYASFDHIKLTLTDYTKVNSILIELKSEAIKERHWKNLIKAVSLPALYLNTQELTLGHIWDINLTRNKQIINDVITVAQGELALEIFLKQVREHWTSHELELINYQNKTKLIKSWDDLFTKLKEHLNSLIAIKLSPYYKIFEEETLLWEDKLNKINNLFDTWIDVQRRWVYLEGIFLSSEDIKLLLPNESNRFSSISVEFLSLMKRVAKDPKPLDIINIPGIVRSLDRLADFLTKIQKALGEYLERERNSFPRFYFIGDEDLLEIIGNSKNLLKLQKHFKKMFSGIHALLIADNDVEVLGMASKEGEEITFSKPINIQKLKINEWLNQVEKEMRNELARLLSLSVQEIVFSQSEVSYDDLLAWIDKYPIQLITLASGVWWTKATETQFSNLTPLLQKLEKILEVLAHSILVEQPLLRRKKYEHLINEFVHKRGLTRNLIMGKVSDKHNFMWMKQMRYYYDEQEKDALQRLTIRIGSASFTYGYEYLGVIDKLVQTPLTDKCYLSMTHALDYKLGGSPFGPAGTGKTESVKSLGHSLGRFVLVFNCDETFDFQAMGRIFIGLCQVGAWGCFDEFNRLEERMLSAVSQQIQTIQEALKSGNLQIDLLGKQLTISPQMATFITMNPGYTGRSNLPDNLKALFRSLAMTTPDRQLIAEVMLFSQGFKSSESLASKVVPFFQLCEEQLSKQSHYDFGLRALKSVLVSSGNLKREHIQRQKADALSRGEAANELEISGKLSEEEILIQSLCETIVPKLVAQDISILFDLLRKVFPDSSYVPSPLDKLKEIIRRLCKENQLQCGDDSTQVNLWMEKVLQLYQIQSIHHGVMLVGNSGTGKTAAWKILLKSLQELDNVESNYFVINPKSISKENLYGMMDPNTREWSDGLFTQILRRIIDNLRGERSKRQWIVFDGDVDPDWVENLNSVLDDNKLLTLPNGERLPLPSNVRLIFEVQDLKHATLATVSRCGMVWFSTDVVSNSMLYHNYLSKLREIPLDEGESGGMESGYWSLQPNQQKRGGDTPEVSPTLQLQQTIANLWENYMGPDALVEKALYFVSDLFHIMDFTPIRSLSTLFSMLNEAIRRLIQYNVQHSDFPLDTEGVIAYAKRSILFSLLWSFTGDTKLRIRSEFSDFLRKQTTADLPPGDLIDYDVSFKGWSPWLSRVPKLDIDTNKVGSTDCVIPTVDTIRHEKLLRTWLNEHKPLVLCGPPGSGKTMTLLSALRALPDMEVISLNFSSATTPELLLKTFDHHCEYKKTPNGIFLSPIQMGKWLILFCDEINLPEFDKYGTQRVISFLRQLVEYGTFYNSEHQLIRLDRIQFVGACNPPTDPGRKPLSHRFLRHVPIIYVDYPGETSLKQIYGTFTHAMMKLHPSLLTYSDAITSSMVEFYLRSQERFTQDMQPHYIYSPRELTRWVRGIYEAIRPLEELDLNGLVRLWAHEGLRLFQDRLVQEEEREWTNDYLDGVAHKFFPTISQDTLKRPILYSNWLSKNYISVDPLELRDYIKARLQIFYQEELDIPLVLFDDLLEHILRIDRIFKQTQGHLLLIGMAGSGKTTISRFVAWINGLKVFQIKVHNRYTSEDFDNDLKTLLKLTGVKNEKICFILDEANVLDSSFLERMNTLLANGEVPGVFEGDEYNSLMIQIKEAATKSGLMLDTNEELYKYFCNQIIKNLHIIFTMNPKNEEDLKARASTSPALFNRCVLDWYGNWSDYSLFQVGKELTIKQDLDKTDYATPHAVLHIQNPTYRDVLIATFLHIHNSLIKLNAKLTERNIFKVSAITPRHFLDFIKHFTKLYNEKRSNLEDDQLHLTRGLNKIKETVEQIGDLKAQLEIKSKELNSKNEMANLKLKEMMEKQQEAERRKVVNQSLQEGLVAQNHAIKEKQIDVKKDLDHVEPAVRDAESAVQSIKKNQLVEVRSMANPPALVKLALESICLLLGEFTTDWKQIRTIIMRENFISTIVNFNTDDITDEIRGTMKAKYLSNPDFNFEKVNRASLACGPLVKWAIAQYHYSDILKKIEPLRTELANLQSEAESNQKKSSQVTKDIKELEAVIVKYKEEYAGLISQASVIKNDLELVETRVTRSLQLIKKLSSESERWEESSKLFNKQMDTLVGDVILSAAFLTYAGYYDQHYRHSLWNNWRNFLEAHEVQFKPELALCEYLSHPDERLRWKEHSLPDDDLCTENAIMIKRFNRFPLIIDPSGQAIEFLQKEYADKKLSITSFLDDSFRKNLESALRFGNPLLVQDAENYDPLLNPVLNYEVKRSGGRVLITIGEQDIDLSPAFNIFLSTRDPSVEFPSDLASRVTFVNFTTTRSSLQYQCLNSVLKSERPDIDQKRSNLLKVQGEFQVRLRQLEKHLLLALNETKGKLLDDDTILSTLENLKTEAIEITSKMEEGQVVIKEIETVSREYVPLANHCSSIHFTLENLNQVHFLYQYSLQFFLEIFNTVLLSEGLKTSTDNAKRIEILTYQLFKVTYDRVSRGMLHGDKLILALLLAKIFTKTKYDEFFNILIHSMSGTKQISAQGAPVVGGLSKEESMGLDLLESKLPKLFPNLRANVKANTDDFLQWIRSPVPEVTIPPYLLLSGANAQEEPVRNRFERIFLTQAVRPDRLLTVLYSLVEDIFGPDFHGNAELNLTQIIQKEINCNTPILLCSVPGYDPSARIETLAAANGIQLASIAIGSAEGFTQADASIKMGTKNGRWVLLKNVHLAPSWLLQLEKKLHSLTPHPNFRLFLTMDINPKIPINLLRSGRIFVYESPPGIKHNLLRVFNTLSPQRMGKIPVERSKLYFLLAWFHAIVQERLRYVPLGWSKTYDFNESDLLVAYDTIDSWVDACAANRTNLSPEKIPWDALNTLLADIIYGGKLDQDSDSELLRSLLKDLFNPKCFDSDFYLIYSKDSSSILIPDAIKYGDYLNWINKLNHTQQTPSWLGLPNSAEKILLTQRGGELIKKLLEMEAMQEEEYDTAF